MSELRLNLITREWVIIATERAKRPEEFRGKKNKKNLPEYLDSCPFCPGNEQRTPEEIMRIPYSDSWKIRVAPNKFAALSPKLKRERKTRAAGTLSPGSGNMKLS
jgi:UDPglucose--hexose-1-phosphate uridylyltransferase